MTMRPDDSVDIARRDFLAGTTALTLAALGIPKVALARIGAPVAAPRSAFITKVGVYPAVGICRVGNSTKSFLAPEVPGLHLSPDGGYKNGDERIKKQVQRFRIYGFDHQGRVVREVTAREAKITWTVHVANTKATWYGFNNPLDNKEVAPGLPGQRRNQFIMPVDRQEMLVIDPGPVSISGANINATGDAPPYRMVGKFWQTMTVKLGELRRDDAGRLLVFPGDGDSASAIPNNPINNFSDNDAWYDNWCDGWVQAEVEWEDRKLDAEHAWVVCCGPNFAPEIPPFITLYDTIRDVMVKKDLQTPQKPPLSFRRDIYPFFHRPGLMEWVATAANLRQGWIRVGDFLDRAYIKKLANPSTENREFRTHVLRQFRNPGLKAVQQYQLPYMLGDGVNYDFSPVHWFLMPKLQYEMLMQWAEGHFVDDFDEPEIDNIRSLDDVILGLQPDALTRAALEPCSGGAFHPGVELTWPMRHEELYSGLFRIARGNRKSLIQDIGPLLTPEKAFAGANGVPPPIGPQMPGDLTRWMGIPWQCDAFSCQQVEYANDFPNAVWWPALLPIDVLPEAYYKQLMRKDLRPDVRLKFLEQRVSWSRGVAGIGYHAEASYSDGLGRMVALWDRMGFVVRRLGPTDVGAPPGIPKDLFVEVGRGSVNLDTDNPPHQRPNEGVRPK